MVVSYIGGRNQGTRRKQPTCHIMLYQAHLTMKRFEFTTFLVIGTDCTGSCKSNYHTITTTIVPDKQLFLFNYNIMTTSTSFLL